jgi:hypothetical protein
MFLWNDVTEEALTENTCTEDSEQYIVMTSYEGKVHSIIARPNMT